MRYLCLFALLALAACTSTPNPTQARLTSKPETFGPWVLQGCKISTKNADVLISTQGRLNAKGELAMKLMFAPHLTRPPYAQIDNLAIPVPIEGQGRHFTLFMPYNPEATGAMLAEGLKLRIAYQRLGDTGFQEVAFPSQGLFAALAAMGAGCP